MFQNIPSFSRYFEQQIYQNVSSADIEVGPGEKKKKKSVHRTRSEDPFLLVNIKSDIQLAFYAFTILLVLLWDNFSYGDFVYQLFTIQ